MKKEEAKDTDKVQISMTTEEKEQFVKFLAEKKETKEREEEGKRIVEADLRFGHQINGKLYGPGKTKTDALTMGTLIAQDVSAYESLLKSTQSDKKMIQLHNHGGYTIREVQ